VVEQICRDSGFFVREKLEPQLDQQDIPRLVLRWPVQRSLPIMLQATVIRPDRFDFQKPTRRNGQSPHCGFLSLWSD